VHDAFDGPNTSVRILQPASNTDFEVEAKFDSPMNQQYQSMGIIVAQDGTNYLRFDAYSDGSDLRLFAGRIINGSGQVKLNVPIAVNGTAPVWLRLKKVTNLWTESYSFNGKDFTEGFTFGDDLIMDSIGVLAANSGGSPPAFTALFDYFRNTEVVKAALGLKLFLEGPFNTSTNLMNTTLKSGGSLATKFPGAAIPASAVDSINIEIRNASSGSGSSYRRYAPAWLMSDGSIRAFGDTAKNYVEFDTTGGSFYIVVRHRNHISVMSSTPQAISFAPAVYDFSTAQSKATGTNPMKKVSTSGADIFALYTGNVTPADQIINAQDRLVVKNALLQTGYVIADVNLNGTVNATDRLLVKNNLLITSYVP
jgi:regulation of enolase protein 1 (concanavalin A-like superfamily)